MPLFCDPVAVSATLFPLFSLENTMSISLLIFLISDSFILFAFYSLYKADRRRRGGDRRQREFILPTQRRKAHRRRTGLAAHFDWAIRTHVSRFAKPKQTEQVEPKRKPGPRVEYH